MRVVFVYILIALACRRRDTGGNRLYARGGGEQPVDTGELRRGRGQRYFAVLHRTGELLVGADGRAGDRLFGHGAHCYCRGCSGEHDLITTQLRVFGMIALPLFFRWHRGEIHQRGDEHRYYPLISSHWPVKWATW